MTDPREAMYRDPVSQARGLAAIASAAGIEAALREGARHLAAVSGARLSALYYVRDGEIVREALHPEDVAGQVEAVVAAKRAALAAAAGEPGGTAEEHRATRVPVDGDGAATLAEFVIWVRAGEAPEPPEVVALADAALTLLAARLGASAAGERTRARQEQYERWFQTLDAQLRILDRERQKFAAIANQPDSYAFVTDGTRTVRWHNKALATLLGGGEPDWVGHACHEVCGRIGLVDGPEGCARCPVRRAFDTNASCQVEVRRGEGADERDLYLIALPIKGPDGKPLEVLGEIRDVTNLEVVRRAKERLETVVAGAPIVLFAIDANGRFTLSVGKGLEPLGLAPGEVVGRSVFEMYRDVPEIVDSIRRALAGDTLTRRVDVGSLSFDSTFAPLRNADGRVVGMIGVSTDVTERRRAEEALRRSEEELRHAQRIEAIGSLAGGVAHDFNNLLTAVFGHLNFLRGRVTPGSDVAREVDAIGRAADRAATLTRQLLAFSRKQVLQPKAVDTNDVIRGMEPMLRRLIREDVELRITADAARPWIDADPGQIEQVVMNLVVNARDAMPQGGRLMIRTANVSVEADGAGAFPIPEGAAPPFEPRGPVPAGRYVVLSVQDSGIGMDATTQARAFEPFFTTKPVGEGTGLGLSTVYGIVKQSGGEIFLTSAPGSGALFTIYFPERGGAPAVGVEGGASGTRGEGKGARAGDAEEAPALARAKGGETVLLVEDERMVRDLFRDVLREAGYVVLEAESGEKALELATSHEGRIHLMVTDVVMPGMGGGELVERMAVARPDTKAIYVSGYTDDVLVRRGVLDSGMPFLQKPCMPDQLTRAVRAALDAPARPASKNTGTRSGT